MFTVQIKVFVPVEIPDTTGVSKPAPEKVPVPADTDQRPTPAVGELADNDTVGEQTVWLFPGWAGPGKLSTLIKTVELFTAQIPLLMLHLKILFPAPRLVIPDEANVGVITFPLPVSKDQVPAPTVGTLALSKVVGVVMQRV